MRVGGKLVVRDGFGGGHPDVNPLRGAANHRRHARHDLERVAQRHVRVGVHRADPIRPFLRAETLWPRHLEGVERVEHHRLLLLRVGSQQAVDLGVRVRVVGDRFPEAGEAAESANAHETT